MTTRMPCAFEEFHKEGSEMGVRDAVLEESGVGRHAESPALGPAVVPVRT